MNNKGQFSIIAALLVAVILIATVIVTYSTIRNRPIHEMPQVLSAIDETNLALRQILGFTIGYYGSVLQVTGNSSFAKEQAENYLSSGLLNIANMHPNWAISFDECNVSLNANWFSNASYSMGNIAVRYSLTGLGMQNITYHTSAKLAVNIMDTISEAQVKLLVSKDGNEPVIKLGKQDFKFYHYASATSTWEQVNPEIDPIVFANGTYIIDIPSGVDAYSYFVQVEDSRGIIVVAASYSQYSCTFSWHSALTSALNYVDNNTSNVDSSEDKGTHSNFPAQQSFDGVFDTLTEGKTSKNFLAKKGTFQKITATGTQTISGVGFPPKAVIFWWTRQETSGETASLSIGYGFATNYNGTYQNRGVAFASDDNAGTSNAGRRRSETYSIIILSNGNPTLGSQASVTAFNSDGFVLNWQTNDGRADIIHYVALGGEDIENAKAGTFTLTTASGTQDINNVGFQPNFAMFLWTFTENTDTNTANAEGGMGFAVSSTKRAALVAVSRDDRPATDTYQQQRTDACILLLDPTSGSQDARVDFSQFLNNGFRINKNDPPASNTQIFYLVLKGGNYDVGSFNSPTLTGTQDIKTLGFQPALLMLATQGRQATQNIGATAEIAFGAATSSSERGLTWFEDPDGLQTSDNEMETLTTKIIQWRDRTGSNTFAIRGSADFTAFLSDGFRLNWTHVESGRQILYVAFGGSNYELDLEVQWIDAQYNGTIEELCIYADVTNAIETLRVDVWHNNVWVTLIPSLTTGWNNVSVISYLNGPTFTIRFKDNNDTRDGTQNSWRIDATLLKVWPTKDLYELMQDASIVVELLQNGTMRWLGQNLQLATQAKPIPPIPVRSIRVNQTINGVNKEVPFQIEDWASDYTVPLGLTSNASVFNNRMMIVFLVNSKVSKVTIWWNGSDTAKQTSYAYTNRYFTGDNPSGGVLTNGILRLQFGSGFTLTSTVIGTSTTSTTRFMRINEEWSVYGADPAYTIHHGIVRDIVQQEAEWSGGVDKCPNVYSHIVLTLPANATYFTYQLRLMFTQSQQNRIITDLCPIRVNSSIGQPQTENGTVNGYPVISSASGLFYNYSSSTWKHHWSQFISGTKGAGIMFTDYANRMLYAFDNATLKTGALHVDVTNRRIELLPVSNRGSASFTSSKDVIWYGAVVTFDATSPIYLEQDANKLGLWIIVEYPPLITVTTER